MKTQERQVRTYERHGSVAISHPGGCVSLDSRAMRRAQEGKYPNKYGVR